MIRYPNGISKEDYVRTVVKEFSKIDGITRLQINAIIQAIIDDISRKICSRGEDPRYNQKRIEGIEIEVLGKENLSEEESGEVSASYGDLYQYKIGSESSAKKAIAKWNLSGRLPIIYPQGEALQELLELQKVVFEKCVKEIISENKVAKKERSPSRSPLSEASSPNSQSPSQSPNGSVATDSSSLENGQPPNKRARALDFGGEKVESKPPHPPSPSPEETKGSVLDGEQKQQKTQHFL